MQDGRWQWVGSAGNFEATVGARDEGVIGERGDAVVGLLEEGFGMTMMMRRVIVRMNKVGKYRVLRQLRE